MSVTHQTTFPPPGIFDGPLGILTGPSGVISEEDKKFLMKEVRRRQDLASARRSVISKGTTHV
jgi:hypothetical protein